MKKISTKLTLAMLCLTVAVLAFVGAALILSMTLDYYRDFTHTVELLFETDRFAQVCEDAAGDKDVIFKYVTDNEAVLCSNSNKECYVLINGNIVKSSVSGGLVELSDNLRAVLDGGVSTECTLTSDALDFAVHTGYGTVLYIRDTRAELYAQIRSTTFLFLQALALGVVLALVLSIVISRRLTASLKKLEQGARLMRGGKFRRVETASKDEVGALCTVFNEMGEQIQADYAEFERIESSRREFVANVSHELKTPLTVIKSYSQTLSAMDVDRDTSREFLGIIDSEIDRMTGIVAQLLKLSQLESKSTVLSESVDIGALVSELLSTLDIKIKEKSVDVTVTGGCTLTSDRNKIKTILLNLISNAVKYCNEGGKVEIEMDRHSVRVRDNGIGISKEDLPRVFERFYRTDKARGRDTGGTGLGLAIAKECADSIGATLSVQSVQHKYTEFKLEFNND